MSSELSHRTQSIGVSDAYRYRNYKKKEKIDEGAFGVVSKAIRLSDNALVAIKEVDLRKKRAKRLEEMRRELYVLQNVQDELVVRFIEHLVVRDTLVIVMEYCSGGNLTTYLRDRYLSEQEAIHFFKQMALSVKILHRRGIAHRDVKLNNFLLDGSKNQIKISDFGLSVVSYKKTRGVLMARTYCGTEPYMAPEILRRDIHGFRCYNPFFADLWALGICLYAMTTRTFPFKVHSSQEGLYKAQTERRWRFPKNLNEAVTDDMKDLCWHMLDPDCNRRVTINGVMAHRWLNKEKKVVLSYDKS